ncbi:MAG TPA: glycosyltransferase [Thermoanaerobaculia bacterium]|nr:glycosyltransferase [Thermoanaerobaculia bacterium]
MRRATDEPPTELPVQRELKLSVLVPVYNERYLAGESLKRLLAAEIGGISGLEVIVVDDGSRDGTGEVLDALAAEEPDRLRLIRHETNRGKGAAVRTAIEHASGDLIVFHDADLEYDPRDFGKMVRPFLEDGADVVYGSRFLPSDRRRVLYFRHTLGNRFITWLSNLFTDLNLTDIETCYKMFRAPLLKSIPIRSNDFRMEPEITAKVGKRRCRVFEVPISYLGRTYQEGKKIGWRDGFKALGAILHYAVVDDLYQEDQYGSHILHDLERAHRFNRWMAETVRPWVGDRVLEIGAGIGNITHWLLPRAEYVASDVNPHYLDYLTNTAAGKPYLQVARVDLEDGRTFEPWRGHFDTVICLNVLEHVRDPITALKNMFDALDAGGRLILYVPAGQGLYSSLDEVLEHRCRYSEAMLRQELESVGFELESLEDFNRFSRPGWWWNGKVLRRRSFSRLQLKLVDTAVPVIRRLDRFIPWKGLGLMAVARKPGAAAAHPAGTGSSSARESEP